MKLISAIIKPFKLDDVREALSEIGVNGITVTEVKGFGRQKAIPRCIVGRNMWLIFTKIKIEIACRDEMVDSIIESIIKVANTGKIGDGKIFVSPLERVIRIRTGEFDESAL